MDWILEHLQVLIVIAAAVFAILQKFKIVRTPGTNAPAAEENPEQAERTRRIQEEIRRRIMERRGQPPGMPTETEAEAEPAQLPAPPPVIGEVRPALVPPPVAPAVVVLSADRQEMKRQEVLLDQLRQWEAVAPAIAAGESVSAAGPVAGVTGTGRTGLWLADLRSPAGLRRAVVLREILGPPVGLR